MASITLTLTDKLRRKLGALQALSSGTEDEIGDFDAFASEALEKAVDNLILQHLLPPSRFGNGSLGVMTTTTANGHIQMPNIAGLTHEPVHAVSAWTPPAPTFRRPEPKRAQEAEENHGLAEGLSYEEIEDDGYEEEQAAEQPKAPARAPAGKKRRRISKPAGLTLEKIEKDSEVEDPEHEAVSASGEDVTFEQLLGSPLSTEDVQTGDESPFASILDLSNSTNLPPRKNGRRPPSVRGRVSAFTGVQENSF